MMVKDQTGLEEAIWNLINVPCYRRGDEWTVQDTERRGRSVREQPDVVLRPTERLSRGWSGARRGRAAAAPPDR